MSFKGIVVCIFALMLGAATFAGEKHRMRVEFAVDANGAEVLRFDGVDSDFSLDDLQVGESRTITGESGQTALVVRTEDGFEFDIDGEKIMVGDMASHVDYTLSHGEHHGEVIVNTDKNVHVTKAVKILKFEDAGTDNGVTIVTADSLDESTKQQIRDVLSSSGHTGEVTFLDTNISDGDHAGMERVHIITNEVDVTN